MSTVVLKLAVASGIILIGAGLWTEFRARFAWRPPLRAAVRQHPAPAYGVLESALWLGVLITLIDHLTNPHGPSAWVAWALTIGPHEIGHLICMPVGWTLQFLGGSIWQVLWWLLLAIYLLMRHRRITGALLTLALVGHSFINLSPYIGDARARDLPLLFGMDSSHHDWWNLLNRYGLLEYDHTLALIAKGTGIAIVLLAAGAGLLTTWLLPRRQLGPAPRFVFKTDEPDLDDLFPFE